MTAYTKDNQGYLIHEATSERSLIDFKPNFKEISDLNSRALIIFSLKKKQNRDISTFRYFAPQFGNNEDKATGSAAAVLTEYFGAFKSLSEIFFFQASPNNGGLMKGEYSNDAIRIYGNIQLTKSIN